MRVLLPFLLFIAANCVAGVSPSVLDPAPRWCGPALRAPRSFARKALSEPIPPCADETYLIFHRTGNRTVYQKEANTRLYRLIALANAAQERDDDDVLKALERYLEAICSERAWTMPAHDYELGNFNGNYLSIDLGSSHRAAAVAYVIAAVGKKLPPELVERAKAEIKRRVFDIYTPKNRRHGWFHGKNNWNAVCHSGCVRAALAVIDSPVERAAFIDRAVEAMPYYLAGFHPDGYCTEGMGYWNYGFGEFLLLVEAVKDATHGAVDLSKLPGASAPMNYALEYRMDAGHCPNFADGGGSPPNTNSLATGFRLWPEFAARKDEQLPPRTWFETAQVYIGRTERMSFAIKGGNNDEMHNHNDLGSWALIVGGKMVAGDPGCETYTGSTFSKHRYESPFNGSHGHPVPVVAGERQSAGAKFAAKVLMTEFSSEKDEIELDLSGAYVPIVEGHLGSLVRKMTFFREKGAVAIVDNVKFKRPAAFESPIVSPLEITINSDGKSVMLGGTLKVSAGVQSDVPWHLEKRDFDDHGAKTNHIVSVVFDAPVKTATVGWRFGL